MALRWIDQSADTTDAAVGDETERAGAGAGLAFASIGRAGPRRRSGRPDAGRRVGADGGDAIQCSALLPWVCVRKVDARTVLATQTDGAVARAGSSCGRRPCLAGAIDARAADTAIRGHIRSAAGGADVHQRLAASRRSTGIPDAGETSGAWASASGLGNRRAGSTSSAKGRVA